MSPLLIATVVIVSPSSVLAFFLGYAVGRPLRTEHPQPQREDRRSE